MKCSCPTKFDDHSRAIVRASLDQSCQIHGARTQALPHCATCTCGVGSQIVQTPAGADAQSDEVRRLKDEVARAMAVLIPMVDVGQRRLNGGPYCIHVEGDGFCGRAKAWDGHHLGDKADWPGHPFVDGEWLAEAALGSQP